ncbi:Ig-like domain-containing protein, partial [Propionivibrio sp.]|uniref:Ig-like domain-containing protein n=1 Tax=Propionivibrio sp. TaxID=2212460 RepID=UPI003BF1E752
ADVATAIEAGGLANATAGTAATGNVLTNDTDIDTVANGETKTVTVGTGARTGTYGTLTLNADGSYSYVVDESNPAVQALRVTGQTVSEVFNYAMRDAGGLTSASTLTVTVDGRNDTPLAFADSATTPEDTPVSGNVLTNDTDVDSVANGETKTVTQFVIAGDSATYLAGQTATIAGKGTLLIAADGTFTFTPFTDYSGAIPLATYTVRDTQGATATATLSLAVTPVTDRPLVVVSDVTVNEDGTATLSIAARPGDTVLKDIGAEHITQVTISGIPDGAALKLADGSRARLMLIRGLTPPQLAGLRFEPAHDFSGSVTLTVVARAMDGNATISDSVAQLLVITVAPVSDTPTLADPGSVTIDVDQSVILAISGTQTDIDGSETLSIRIDDIPAGASISANGVSVAIVNGRAEVPVPANGVIPVISLTPPRGSDVGFVLRVSTVSKDGSALEAVTSKPLPVTIRSLPLPALPPTVVVEQINVATATTNSSPTAAKSVVSDDGSSTAGAAENRNNEVGRLLALRTGLPLQADQGAQAAGGESRKLESTDRGFPVERMQAASTTVQDQQKGGERLFVFNGINNATTNVGQGLNYTVPKDAFGHTNTAAIVQLEASQSDGSPLPEWMDFDPTSGTFSGRPPANAQSLIEVKVTARDDQGREASANFKMQIEGGRALQPAEKGGAAAEAPPGPAADAGELDASPAAIKLAAQRAQPATRGAIPFSDQLKLSRHDPLVQRILTRPSIQAAPRVTDLT